MIQCGIGKIAAATAVGFLAQLANAQRSDAWLNIGIAGSGSFELGALVIAHKIIDEGAKKNWYPSQLFQGPRLQLCPSTIVRTVDTPLEDYPPEGVVEMEALLRSSFKRNVTGIGKLLLKQQFMLLHLRILI